MFGENEMDEIRRRDKEASEMFERNVMEQNVTLYREFEKPINDLLKAPNFSESMDHLKKTFRYYGKVTGRPINMGIANLDAMMLCLNLINATCIHANLKAPPIVLSMRDHIVAVRSELLLARDAQINKHYERIEGNNTDGQTGK